MAAELHRRQLSGAEAQNGTPASLSASAASSRGNIDTATEAHTETVSGTGKRERVDAVTPQVDGVSDAGKGIGRVWGEGGMGPLQVLLMALLALQTGAQPLLTKRCVRYSAEQLSCPPQLRGPRRTAHPPPSAGHVSLTSWSCFPDELVMFH